MPCWNGLVQPAVVSFSFLPVILYLLEYGVKEDLQNGNLIIPGDQWPAFLYAGLHFDPDDPWKGLFRNTFLVSVSPFQTTEYTAFWLNLISFKAYKHIFTLLSSVESVNKATQSGNAQIHGMTQVTPASIAYITTQVLMNSIVFIAFVDTGMS